jgi:hypothetical protein
LAFTVGVSFKEFTSAGAQFLTGSLPGAYLDALDTFYGTYGVYPGAVPIWMDTESYFDGYNGNLPDKSTRAPKGSLFPSNTLLSGIQSRGATPCIYFTTNDNRYKRWEFITADVNAVGSNGLKTYLDQLCADAIAWQDWAATHGWDDTIILRFNQEMNGLATDKYGHVGVPYMPWGIGDHYSSSTTVQYSITSAQMIAGWQDLWRYIHDYTDPVSGTKKVTCLKFFYCVQMDGSQAIADNYPGDGYAAYVGGDAYAWAPSDGSHSTLWTLAAASLDKLHGKTSRPIIFGESSISQRNPSTMTGNDFTGTQRANWMDGDGFAGSTNGSYTMTGVEPSQPGGGHDGGIGGILHCATAGTPGPKAWSIRGFHWFNINMKDPNMSLLPSTHPEVDDQPDWRIQPQTTAFSGILALSTGGY